MRLDNLTPNGSQSGAPSSNGANGKVAGLYSKSNPFPARLLRNILLNKPGSDKEVRHYEISLDGSGLGYEAGDALGVLPVNCHALVDVLLATLDCKGEEPVTVGKKAMPLREALTRHLDITKPSQEMLDTIARAAPGSELGAATYTPSAVKI